MEKPKLEFDKETFRKGIMQIKAQLVVCIKDIAENKSMNRRIQNAEYNMKVINHNVGILLGTFNQHFPPPPKKEGGDKNEINK